jgi:uncharacterized protein (DUF1499 family)
MPQCVIRQVLTLFVGCLLGLASWSGGAMPAIAVTHFSPPTGTTIASLFSFSGTRPTNLGIHDGKFAPCPSSPNCVSSQSQDMDHRIAPFTYEGSPEASFARLKSVVRSLPRTEVIAETDDYLYTEFTSALMGFVDDVEFFLNRDANEIEVRSASRLGESDLGVNRQRIEQIRSQLNQPNLAA